MKSLIFVFFCLLFCLGDDIMGIVPEEKQSCHHECRWNGCPYKGVPTVYGEWNEAVFELSGCEEGSDCYYIDMLHLQFPEEDADQLHDRLFMIDKDSEGDASLFWDNLTEANRIYK